MAIKMKSYVVEMDELNYCKFVIFSDYINDSVCSAYFLRKCEGNLDERPKFCPLQEERKSDR